MGFNWVFLPPKSSSLRRITSLLHPSAVDQYLANEVFLGRVADPFSVPPYPNLHVSSFRVIPKRGQPGKWRLIVDLSSPGRASVNNGIDPHEFTLHYITVDQVIRLVSNLVQGPSRPNLMWRQLTQCACTPISPRSVGDEVAQPILCGPSSPLWPSIGQFIFNSIADMVEWILVTSYQIPDLLHYLDGFITAGPAQSSQCAQNLATALEVCHRLGLPLHPVKCIGPSTRLVVLGIELDSVNQVAHLPQEKLLLLQELIGSWLPRK